MIPALTLSVDTPNTYYYCSAIDSATEYHIAFQHLVLAIEQHQCEVFPLLLAPRFEGHTPRL